MKRPASSAETAVTPSPKPRVLDQLSEIDMAILDRLLSIRREEEQLREFRDRAEKHRKDVSESVYRRVIEDYATRVTALEQQALPLRSKARTEYRKLRQLADKVGREYEQAKLAKEELEFRHAVGELDVEQFGRQLQEPQRLLDDCRADVACLEEHKARFIDAMGSEAALQEPVPPQPERIEVPPRPAVPVIKRLEAEPVQAPAPISRPEPQPVEPVVAQAAAPPPAAPARPPLPPLPVPPAIPSIEVPDDPVLVALQRKDETLSHFLPEDEQAGAQGPSPISAPPSAPDEPAAEPTIMVPLAALTSGGEWGAPKEFQLGAVTYLGRGGGNHLQITSPSVSRKHAVITASPRGFTVKDLNSQNGVSVNTERVTEQLLSDGDRLEIGDVVFVFRSPWPTLGAPKPDVPGAQAGPS
jgi:FHA domain-containing protein